MTPHRSPFSGSWYPASSIQLRELLDSLVERSRERAPFIFPNALGYVVPHAAPQYSGAVAAAAYRGLQEQRPERIVLLAFPHHGRLTGVVSPDVSTVATPLGDAAIETGFAGFPVIPEESVCDHSFEIQLPFLQTLVPGARIAPLYAGGMSAEERGAAAEALTAAWRPGTVFVASSDLTHYGRSFGYTPFPADGHAADRLRELDFECIEAAATLDSGRFRETLGRLGATVCGTDPIALLIEAIRRIDPAVYTVTLDYDTSGEITGDFRHSVSYGALGFFPRAAFELEDSAGRMLLESAATTLGRLRSTLERRAIAVADPPPSLRARLGSFVTLRQGDSLLGCMGNVEGRRTLAEDVAALTLAAALEDPRFPPAASTPGPIDIDISVLTPLRRITGPSECSVGKHGLLLIVGKRSGLLLPQVAAERGWSAEEFLEAVCQKSLLPPNAWRDPKARLYVFEAQVFGRAAAAT